MIPNSEVPDTDQSQQTDPADEADTRIYAHRIYLHADYEAKRAVTFTVMTDGKNFLSFALDGGEYVMSVPVARKLADALNSAADYAEPAARRALAPQPDDRPRVRFIG